MPDGGASACLVCCAPLPIGVEACPACRTPVPRAKAPRISREVGAAPPRVPVSPAPPAPPRVPSLPPVALAAPAVHGATPPSALSLGTVVDNKYEVRQVLGAGGFGEVYRVYHRVLCADFALKTLHPGLLLDPNTRVRERFFREARILMGLIHTNLVPLREVGEWEGLLYITMDLCPGETLSSLLKRRGRLPAREAARLAIPVLRALEYAHGKGIVHRDLKPANLIMSEGEGGSWEVKVLDFGVAKILHEDGAMDDDGPSLTATGAMVGTLAYMSPEQAQGLEIDARSDLFSMGAVLYQAVTGRRPFDGRNPRETAMKILLHAAPSFKEAGATDADLPGLEALVMRCLSKEPADRPASAREFRHELNRLLDGGRRTGSGPVEPLQATMDPVGGPMAPDAPVAETSDGPAAPGHGLAAAAPLGKGPSPGGTGLSDAFPPTEDRATGPTVDAPGGESGPASEPKSDGRASESVTGRRELETSPSQATALDGAQPHASAGTPVRPRLGCAVSPAGVTVAVLFVVMAAVLSWQLGWIPDLSRSLHPSLADDLEAAQRGHDEAIAEAHKRVKLSDWEGAEAAVHRARGFRVDSKEAATVESTIRAGRATDLFASVRERALAAIPAEPAPEEYPYRAAIELVRNFAEGPDAGSSLETAREFLDTLKRQEAKAVSTGHEKALAEARKKRWAHDWLGAADATARARRFVPNSAEAEALLAELKKDEAREALEGVKAKARAALPTGAPAAGPHPYRAAVELARAFAEGQSAEPIRQEAREFANSLGRQETAAVQTAHDGALAEARAHLEKREWIDAQAAVQRAFAFDPGSAKAARVQADLVAAAPAGILSPAGPAGLIFPGCRATSRNAQGRDEYLHEKTGIVLVLIPPGEFKMGSPDGEPSHEGAEMQHLVRISRPFLLAKYEVTQAQWQAVMQSNPSYFTKSGNHAPVENVNWEECQEFCRKTGLSLPTEAQWEYACRAGTMTPFHCGSTITTDQVNYDGDSPPYGDAPKGPFRKTTVPVGSFPANGWGLHDMHGNVWEWCEDIYDEFFYKRSPGTDPLCDSGSSNRVARGGSWLRRAEICRSAYRNRIDPGNRSNHVGFRPARALP
ncbi:MAG: SUMF1/EgtB/PvdO family nonheme iron enzyme [Planctomycetes bacterium]|nr:SUMF1/EgtB/PvdO family nonheme iron enzyme [Planctomycetota bacterium]